MFACACVLVDNATRISQQENTAVPSSKRKKAHKEVCGCQRVLENKSQPIKSLIAVIVQKGNKNGLKNK